LEEEDLNPRALLLAAECSVQSGNIDQACALLHIMKEKNLPIRQHYFWPLLASHRDNADGKHHFLLSFLYLLCEYY
jgi:leucine-rich PPR motif-containing protein